MKRTLIATTLLLLPALFLPLLAAESPVYPCPQQCKLQKQYTKVDQVSVSLRTDSSKGGDWNRIPQDKEGAYLLRISPGKVEVKANDEHGVYYAKQTLCQLLRGVDGAKDANKDPFPDKNITELAQMGTLPLGEILDWPDLPYRGTVEGYYGAPWSKEARIAQFEFYGRNKMNTYIYGPKDDSYHHGNGCYEPYPPNQAAELAELVRIARKNHVHFVWAIHPGNTINWNKNEGKDDLDRLCAKLEKMYELGVRDFGVFVDDSSGEIGKANRQVTLCNYLLKHFVQKHPDVRQGLIMCPTGYNKAWANQQYLKELGEGLDPSIDIMWTGNTVVHDITLEGQQWVNTLVKRPTFIWWNWPVNDYKRSRICLGRTYGLGQEKEMLTEMSGFVSNPMEYAEASKIGLFSIADYAWNIQDFDSIPSWHQGIIRLFPQSAKQVQTLCNHTGYLLPNYHAYIREESVDMAEPAKQLQESLASGRINTAAAATLRNEFNAISQAAATIAQAKDTQLLAKEIKPWLTQFELTGKAGTGIMTALIQKNKASRNRAFLEGCLALNLIDRVERPQWSPEKIVMKRDVEVAMKEMTPIMQKAFDYLHDEVYGDLAGKKTKRLLSTFISNTGKPNENTDTMKDGDPKTHWSSEQSQQEGAWFGYDFGGAATITSIELITGANHGKDSLEQAQLEISTNGKSWQKVGDPVQGSTISLQFTQKPLKARMLRFRITKSSNRWLGINEFHVNKPTEASAPSVIKSTIADFKELTCFREPDAIGINRIMEVHQCKPGEMLELSLDPPTHATKLVINLGNEQLLDWATIDLTLEDGSQVTPALTRGSHAEEFICEGTHLPQQGIRSVKLTHSGNHPQEIKLNDFKLNTPPSDPNRQRATLTDGNLSTAYSCEHAVHLSIPVPARAKRLLIVGNATCTVPGATPGDKSPAIQYFTLPEGSKSVNIQAEAQPGKWIQEIIFR